MTSLTRESLLLFLKLLDGSAPVYSRSALAEFHGQLGQDLIEAKLMVPAGYAKSATADDEAGQVRPVTFNGERGEFGYHDPQKGWIDADRTSFQLYRADVATFVTRLLAGSLRLPTSGVIEPVPGLVWNVGHIRLLRRELSPVWFVRRLHDPAVMSALLDAAARWPSPLLRLVLCSTTSEYLGAAKIPLTRIIPISDVLSPLRADQVDLEALKLRFGMAVSPPVDLPVHLSEDGRVLTLNGRHVVRFSSDIHRAVISALVEAWQFGRRVRASEILARAKSSARTFEQAFGRKWKALSPFMHNNDGLWWLEP